MRETKISFIKRRNKRRKVVLICALIIGMIFCSLYAYLNHPVLVSRQLTRQEAMEMVGQNRLLSQLNELEVSRLNKILPFLKRATSSYAIGEYRSSFEKEYLLYSAELRVKKMSLCENCSVEEIRNRITFFWFGNESGACVCIVVFDKKVLEAILVKG